jgi:molecular chaperone GrpE
MADDNTKKVIPEIQEETVSDEPTALQVELEKIKAQLNEKHEAHKRALADYQNLQRQQGQERLRIIELAASGVIQDMLPVLDHLQLALQHFADPSLKMIVDEFKQVLHQHGLEEVPAVGKMFDHQTMEAIDTDSGEKDKVTALRRAGYKLNGQVIRHAQVVVGTGK